MTPYEVDYSVNGTRTKEIIYAVNAYKAKELIRDRYVGCRITFWSCLRHNA